MRRRLAPRSVGLALGLAIAVAGAALTLLAGPDTARGQDRGTLWRIVHSECVPNQMARGDPAPCTLVSLAGGLSHGHAVLKDRRGVAQYLLIPTVRIAGIEDPALLAPGAPNLFAAAWDARRFVEARLGRALPRDAVGLAINSALGRTQDELHIHVDCLRAEVRGALRAQALQIGDRWAPVEVPLGGRRWLAMWLAGEELTSDPFVLLAEGVPGARAEMGSHTLVVVGAAAPDGAPGFVLLDHRADPGVGDRASGEELLDHACAEWVPAGPSVGGGSAEGGAPIAAAGR